MNDYTNRWMCFCKEKGYVLNIQELTHPSKTNSEYIRWINDKWKEFYLQHPQLNNLFKTNIENDLFDEWLIENSSEKI